MSKAEKTRQFIIEKTAPVFSAKGYAGTSLSDLTNVTGLTKGSIYGNFQDKDEVAIAAFQYNFETITNYVKQRILATPHAIERLLVYPAIYRKFLKIPWLKPGCPILNTAIEADDTHPQLKQVASDALSFWKRSIENQVKRGIARREIGKNAKPAQVAVVMISIIEGAVMQAKLQERATELNIAMNFLEDFIRNLQT